MIKARDGCRRQLLLERLVLVGVVGVLYTALADAQPQNVPADLPDGPVADTIGAEDDRLPRMSIGLGIVTDATVRFYPMDLIEERGALVDQVDGRRVLLFVDPTTFTPAALFVDASSATLHGKEIRLDTGRVVRTGLLYDASVTRVDAERPLQLFSRWYGFSLTFPGPEIFGQ